MHKNYIQNIWCQHTKQVYIKFAAWSNLKLTDIYKINSVEKLVSVWTRERSKYAMEVFLYVSCTNFVSQPISPV